MKDFIKSLVAALELETLSERTPEGQVHDLEKFFNHFKVAPSLVVTNESAIKSFVLDLILEQKESSHYEEVKIFGDTLHLLRIESSDSYFPIAVDVKPSTNVVKITIPEKDAEYHILRFMKKFSEWTGRDLRFNLHS